ncbi:hypothetical protein [Sphingopyxis sp. R3-92]|uniref:hypothetical protein n=1 Tax=Sphingopyxis sp. R3-92 TaxID=3158553 RepID=UPI003EE63AAA
MSDENDAGSEFEWDAMIDTVMDLIPAKMTPRECRDLRENIHNSLWASVGDLFAQSTIEFRRSHGEESEIRLWMSVGLDCVDFQKGFATNAVAAKAFSQEDLTRARDILTGRIEAMQREEVV